MRTFLSRRLPFLRVSLAALAFVIFGCVVYRIVQADNTAQSLPFSQNWSSASLITANDNWSGVAGIEGYLGQDITTSTATDPQTLLTTSSLANDLDVIANQSNPNTLTNGGVAEFDGIANPTIALQGSGTADAPYLLLHLNTTGQSNIAISYNLRDIDGSADNAVQPVALQYRVGNAGNFTNIPSAFVADATTGPSQATLVTAVNVILPAACNNQSLVQLRIITTNAANSDEWVGIDDISVKPLSLSINDVTVTEGNAGTTTASFTVSLNAPAPSGGVTFDIATQDNTATVADNDYAAKSLTTQTIPAGSSTYTFDVTVNGDTSVESTESFKINLTNVSGAAVGDAEGVGTITNDDAALPILSINDVTQSEGNSGTTTYTFTVSLNTPAPETGVSFDIATQDNTATTVNNDYVAKSLTGQTISAGNSTYTFDVTVNSDTVFEPNETFLVNVTNVVGAELTDGQGTGTITNDDFIPIHDIQGNGNTSPLSGTVTTRGIVTGLTNNGFFLQSPEEGYDADPNTSEGIFVFTSSAPPAAAVLGNLVEVAGTIAEFIPAADPESPSLTELTSPTVSVISTGHSLPAPIVLTTADTPTGGSLHILEKYEGMRVKVNTLTVVAPTSGNVTESSAMANSNGVFYGVISGIARPFREPGIQADNNPANDIPSGSSVTIPPVPRFDANTERIRVDSDGQTGATPLEVTTSATVSNLVGPLTYSFRTYSILPDAATTPTVTGNISADAVRTPQENEYTIASFNLQRFYDDVNDPAIGDPVLTTTAFNNRLNKASLAIRDVLQTPDILGVVEVENLTTLQTLATKINNDAVAASQPNPNYQAYLIEGNDVGGIDVGFLVKGPSRVNVISVTQEGATATYINPNNGQPELLNDRPPLVLQAEIIAASGVRAPVTVIVNHLRSLNDIDDATDGNRVRVKRRAQAEFLANLVQARQTANPSEKIALVGDFNAFQFNDGFVDSMNTIKGTPAAATDVVLTSADLVNPDLNNLVANLSPSYYSLNRKPYSYIFDGNAQVLDHILISKSLDPFDVDFQYARLNADFPETYRNDANRPERISDHDAPIAYFAFPPVLAINSVTVNEGNSGTTTLEFEVTVSDLLDEDTTVDYTIEGVTASLGSDFTASPLTGTIVFKRSYESRVMTISVEVNGDTMVEPDETLKITLSNPTNGILDSKASVGTGTIINDDFEPKLTINDVTLTEGSAGTTNFVFTVTLTDAAGYPNNITVNYATANGSADSNDYTTTAGTLTFTGPIASNSVTQTITVPVIGDSNSEPNENFFVNLTNASIGIITDAQGLGTIQDDDTQGELTCKISDPLICTGNNNTLTVHAELTNTSNITANFTFTATLPPQLSGIPNSCVISTGTCTVNNGSVTASGQLAANQTVLIDYKVLVDPNTPQGTQLCVNSVGTLNGVATATVQACTTLNCPAGPANVQVSDQKSGSVLVFPYYVSTADGKKDTRLTISNMGTTSTIAHVFFIEGSSCSQADFSLCLTPNASFSFKASEYDPDLTGWLLVVAVDANGLPIQHNSLIGNAFVKDGEYVDNYGAEAFWAHSRALAAINGNTATLFFDGSSYDGVPSQFTTEIQSPLDAPGQKIVTVGLQGNVGEGAMSGASQIGTGLVINGNENPSGSFVSFLSGNCQAISTLSATNPRVPLSLGGMIPSGQGGTMRFNVGAAVGLILTPRSAPWHGIRTLHKTALTTATITIPIMRPTC